MLGDLHYKARYHSENEGQKMLDLHESSCIDIHTKFLYEEEQGVLVAGVYVGG